MRTFFLIFFAFVSVPSVAWAQDDEDDDPFDDLLESDEDETFGQQEEEPVDPNKKKKLEPEFEEPEDDLDPTDPLDPLDPDADQPDLLGDDPNATAPLGADTAETYRATLQAVQGMDPDDEMQTWDAYLRQYPTSAFRPQIEKRMEVLEDEMYDLNRIRRTDDPDPVDADKAQLSFSQGMLIENLNPRRRVQVLVEWGLPDYANLGLDYEHPLARNFSIHGGVRRRFTGFNLEGGARWAMVKSARTNTLVTAIVDVRVNAGPAFVAFRPQLAAGKRFGKLDLQGQAGVDLAPRAKLDLKVIGGLNATYRASDAVGMFAESSVWMGTSSGASGPFRFNQYTFGMKFFPARKAKKPENTEINVGATIPYTNAYWQYHFGSLMGQANFYLD